MRLKQHYAVFPGGLSADDCARIVALGESLTTMAAKVKHDPEKKTRSSDVAWISHKPEHDWVYDLITPFVEKANADHWGWEITKPEPAQYTIYQPGQYYTWHADQRDEPYAQDSRWPGLLRKLSVTVQLTDGEVYEGGNFEIEKMNRGPEHMDKRLVQVESGRALGTVLVFPSHLYHRVLEVTSGTRRSLVAWYVGPPFK